MRLPLLLITVFLTCLSNADGFVAPHSRAARWKVAHPPRTVPSVQDLRLFTHAADASEPTRTQKFVKASTSGLAVSLAMVPEAVAFAFVAGVNPLVGLWTTVVLGFVAAALGGRAGICSSASGACSIVVAALCASHGPAYLSACAILAGVMEIGCGVLGFGKLIRLVPYPVMLGFVNGLAVVMTRAQLAHFKNPAGQFMSITSALGASTYGVAALTMAAVKIIPNISKAVPPTLGAVAFATAIAKLFSIPAKTLADVAGASTFVGGWSVIPKLSLPSVPFSSATFQTILPYAVTMAAVGVIESLLTMQLVDTLIDDGKRGSNTRECLGQGVGNVLSGLTGGIGGCALLGQSVINVQSGGGISRWSGMSMALFLAFGIVLGAPLLASVPVASLVGVMLLVCHSTFNWSSLRLIRKIPRIDAAVIALVTAMTVKYDLASAVISGTILSALGLAWKQSEQISVSPAGDEGKVYKVESPLYFGSVTKFSSSFSVKDAAGSDVILDFSNSQLLDASAVEAVAALAKQYSSVGSKLSLRGLSEDSTKLVDDIYGEDEIPPFEWQSNIRPETNGASQKLMQ